VLQSNGFNALKELQVPLFDAILFNAPFFDQAVDGVSDPLKLGVFDPNHDFLAHVLTEARSFMKPGGIIYLILGSCGLTGKRFLCYSFQSPSSLPDCLVPQAPILTVRFMY
jgi:hypothetical protein